MSSFTIHLRYVFFVPTINRFALLWEWEAMSDTRTIRGRCMYLTFLPCRTRLLGRC